MPTNPTANSNRRLRKLEKERDFIYANAEHYHHGHRRSGLIKNLRAHGCWSAASTISVSEEVRPRRAEFPVNPIAGRTPRIEPA